MRARRGGRICGSKGMLLVLCKEQAAAEAQRLRADGWQRVRPDTASGAEQRLEEGLVALQRDAILVQAQAVEPAELLAAAGAAGSAVQQLGQRGAGAGRLVGDLLAAQVQASVPGG